MAQHLNDSFSLFPPFFSSSVSIERYLFYSLNSIMSVCFNPVFFFIYFSFFSTLFFLEPGELRRKRLKMGNDAHLYQNIHKQEPIDGRKFCTVFSHWISSVETSLLHFGQIESLSQSSLLSIWILKRHFVVAFNLRSVMVVVV